MIDTKTVTFDALIEYLKHTRANHENSIAARDPVIAAHIKDLGEWIDALAAAPTPAAQSAGQEAVAWAVIDNGQVMTFVRHGSDAEETARKVGYTLRPLIYGDAAPVNGGEREIVDDANTIALMLKATGEDYCEEDAWKLRLFAQYMGAPIKL